MKASSTRCNTLDDSFMIEANEKPKSTHTAKTICDDDESDNPSPEGCMSRQDKSRAFYRRTSSSCQVLMGLITKEMVNSIRHLDYYDDGQDGALNKEATLEDIFYAQMNGHSIDASRHDNPPLSNNHGSPQDDDNSLDDDDLSDEGSFAGLDITGDAVENTEDVTTESLRRRRESLVSRQAKVADSIHGVSTTRSSSPSHNNRQNQISVDEIQKYVMDNIPDSVKAQIPAEAWQKMFSEAASVNSLKGRTQSSIDGEHGTTTTGSFDKEITTPTEIFKQDLYVSDDISVISEVTDVTDINLTHRLANASHKESKDDSCLDSVQSKLSTRVTDNSDHGSRSRRRRGKLCRTTSLPLKASSNRQSKPTVRRESIRSATRRSSVRRSSSLPVQDDKGVDGQPRRRIEFVDVQVRYYEQILDINPGCTCGAPLGIGWRYKKGEKMSVDQWESQRGMSRSILELMIPRVERERLLLEIGYDGKDLASAIRINNKLRHQRKQTVNNLGTAPVEEALESATRSVRKLLSLGRNKGLISK